MNNPTNISGLGSLLSASSSDIAKLEKEIIEGLDGTLSNNIGHNDDNMMLDFKSEIEKLTSEILPSAPDDEGVEDGSVSYNSSSSSSSLGSGSCTTIPRWNPIGQDTDLQKMTVEEQKQSHVNSVLKNITVNQDVAFDMNMERDEDEKASILERIDMLKMTLSDDGVEISNVPNVTTQNQLKEIKDVYKSLQLKNDRNRYSNLADEMILGLAYGLEYAFDGKKEWFGRRPDLVGWPETVKVKLRRMRYETSTFVQDIMSEYQFNTWFRLAIELIPSLFLYSRNRRASTNDNLLSDEKYRTEQAANKAISDLNNL